jgi:enolase
MSIHEITAADCTWAEVHFADIGEARQHLDELISTRQSLQSLRNARATISEGRPMSPELKADLERIDRAIRDCQNEEAELHCLMLDCAMDDMFDLV